MSIAEKLTTIAENERRVYDAGYAAGQATGGGGDTEAAYNKGFADGKQSGTDEFWDNLQNYGNRTDYRYAFAYGAHQNVDPKYKITAESAEGIFCTCPNLESVNWEKFDLSATTSLYAAFIGCFLLTEVDTELAVANGTATLLNSVFRNCYALQRVKKITAFPSAVWKQSFENCRSLTSVIFDGTIGANGLNLQWSTGLDKESITSIINALSATTTSGLSITLSETAVNNAFANGDTLGMDSAEWGELIGTKSNWTINLV